MTAIGIDLGTTNTAASLVEGDDSTMIEIDAERTMRSLVTFANYINDDEDAVMVGDGAVSFLESDPGMTISAIKREMGNDYEIDIDGFDMSLTPEMVSGLILKKVAQVAEEHPAVTGDLDDVVITVPARFSEAARRCTEAAAKYGYLDNVYMLLPEPSAACVAYDVGEETDEVEKVAVYDLGGGTFDISIVDIVPDRDAGNQYVVNATDGKQKLGGEDFDTKLQEYIVDEFEAESGVDIRDDDEAMERVRQAAKDAKETLSQAETATVNIPFIAPDTNLKQKVTRETFEELTAELVDETIDICEDVLDGQGYSPEDIDTVLTVGGSTKMPQVEEAVTEFFGQEPVGGVNPDEAVARGAGVQADYFDKRAALPGNDESSSEIARKGSAVTPAAPEDIGFELANGDMEVLIEENTNFPVTNGGEYTTVEDRQAEVIVRIFRGDDPVATENEQIGQFLLENIREAPAGEPTIAIQFELDQSGVLRAEAWDKSIGDRDSAEIDSEFGTGGVEDSYSPPSEETILEQREELPNVK